MRAAVFVGEGKLEIRDVPRPSLTKPDEVVLAVKAAGICGTDVHALEVPPLVQFTPGVVVGHEFSGQVVEAGPSPASPRATGSRCCPRSPATAAAAAAWAWSIAARTWACSVRTTGTAVMRSSSWHPPRRSTASPTACPSTGPRWPSQCRWSSPPRSAWIGIRGARRSSTARGPSGSSSCSSPGAPGQDPSSWSSRERPGRSWPRSWGPTSSSTRAPRRWPTSSLRTRPTGPTSSIDAVGTLLGEALEVVATGGQVVVFGIAEQAKVEVRPFLILYKDLTIIGSQLAKNTFGAGHRPAGREHARLRPHHHPPHAPRGSEPGLRAASLRARPSRLSSCRERSTPRA